MKEHFMETIEARMLPPREARNLTQRLKAASIEWRAIEKALVSYETKRTVLSGTNIFLGLSRVMHELIDDPALRGRLIQHFEQELKNEFPSPPGTLFSA